jgi:hypothetical protein
MSKGVSIHIGLNRVDPAAYNGWAGTLTGCENDARAMQKIADACGYTSRLFLNDQATSAAVCEAIGQTAQELASGDYFLLSYSGHGGQVDDCNGDEDDAQDETWVLYDRMLIDDELYSLWSQFAAGVRIFVLSDSCHSGTVLKDMFYKTLPHDALRSTFRGMPVTPRYRNMPVDAQQKAQAKNQDLYRTLQWIAGNTRDTPIGASVVLISGCQDNQLSMDGDVNGLFTQNLLQVWNSGAFQGDYPGFHSEITAKMPGSQTPNYYKAGTDSAEFEAGRPFDILAGASTQPADTTSASTSASTTTDTTAGTGTGTLRNPTVTGPTSSDKSTPPTFNVDLGGNPYYVFEIARAAALFDTPPDANNADYYGTWADMNQPARLTEPQFQIPKEAWDAISGNATLYFRVCTTSSEDAWNDFRVSEVGSVTVSDARSRAVPQPSMRPPVRRRHPRRGLGSPDLR